MAAPDDGADRRLRTASVRQTVAPGRTLALYLALPAKARGRHPAVLVVNDDRGSDGYARELARHIALEGFVACVPELTAASHPAGLADAVAVVSWLGRNPPGEHVLTGKVGAVGAGRGTVLVGQLAVAAGPALTAAVAFDATPPIAGAADGTATAMLVQPDPPSSAPAWQQAVAFLKEHLT